MKSYLSVNILVSYKWKTFEYIIDHLLSHKNQKSLKLKILNTDIGYQCHCTLACLLPTLCHVSFFPSFDLTIIKFTVCLW